MGEIPAPVTIDPLQILILLIIGLAAGVLGGLMGIGGSVIMIPALAVIFHGAAWDNQHLFQASAMIVNVAVAIPAALRHKQAGAIPWAWVRWFLPATVVAIVAGVLISNVIPGQRLRLLFAAFLVYLVISNLAKAYRKRPDHTDEQSIVTPQLAIFVGVITGVASGVLGIGGGIVSIPLMQALAKIPLKKCIAASATAMVFSAPIGAALKVATLGSLPEDEAQPWTRAIVIALTLAPTAMFGAHLGAGLTHRVNVQVLRIVFALVMLLMAGRMAGLY